MKCKSLPGARQSTLIAAATGFVEPTVKMRVITDREGRVIAPCETALHILNMSARGLIGRRLTLFVTRDRDRLMSLLGGVGADDVVIETTVQPMNRRPRAGTLRIRNAQVTDSRELEWVLELQRVPGDAASKALSNK